MWVVGMDLDMLVLDIWVYWNWLETEVGVGYTLPRPLWLTFVFAFRGGR